MIRQLKSKTYLQIEMNLGVQKLLSDHSLLSQLVILTTAISREKNTSLLTVPLKVVCRILLK